MVLTFGLLSSTSNIRIRQVCPHYKKIEIKLTIERYEQVEDLLLADVGQVERASAKLITAELTFNMFAALCSWTYNFGTGALQRSSLRRLYINEGRYEEAANEMLKWVFCNGRRLRGLVLRRTDERALFLA